MLSCTKCGVSVEAQCSCGAPYVPVVERAKAAIKAAPKKSNRALAAEIGVSRESVRQARSQVASDLPPAEKVEGKDGKSYPAKRPTTTKMERALRKQSQATSFEDWGPTFANNLARELFYKMRTVPTDEIERMFELALQHWVRLKARAAKAEAKYEAKVKTKGTRS